MIPGEQKVIYNYAVKLKPNSNILEVGVAHGRTALIIINATKHLNCHYYGIDNFSMGSTYQDVQSTLSKCNTPFTLLVGDSASVPWTKKVDLLIIDGGHYKQPVKADCKKYIPFVKPGGIVMFHDWDRVAKRSSAHWAIRHYGEIHTKGWKDLGLIHGLKILRRPYEK